MLFRSGNTTQQTLPFKVSNDTNWFAISAGGSSTGGYGHSLALKNDGTLWAWGYNTNGQIGDGTFGNNRLSPVLVGSGYSKIAAGQDHSLAIKNDGTLWGWGLNNRLGISTATTIQSLPIMISSSTWIEISAHLQSFGIKNDGTLWGWGYNGNGEVGTGTIGGTILMSQIGTLSNWSMISAGFHSSAGKTGN